VQAGVAFMASTAFEAKALAGAYINVPELTFGEQYSTNQSCTPASAGININAGVYVDVGAEIGSSELLYINPTVTTTLFSATASTCFGSGARYDDGCGVVHRIRRRRDERHHQDHDGGRAHADAHCVRRLGGQLPGEPGSGGARGGADGDDGLFGGGSSSSNNNKNNNNSSSHDDNDDAREE
jgi:hypothetical protein